MSDSREDVGSGYIDPKADPQYIQFKCLPPGDALNRWSHMITREHDFPGAQVRSSLPKSELSAFPTNDLNFLS